MESRYADVAFDTEYADDESVIEYQVAASTTWGETFSDTTAHFGFVGSTGFAVVVNTANSSYATQRAKKSPMKGMLFALLHSYVVDRWDEPSLDAAIAKGDLATQEPFVGPGTYPDADFHELATRCAEQVGVSRPEFLRGLGEFAFPEFLRFFPQAADGHDHPLPFLRGIIEVVHPEIERLLSRSRTPTLTLEEATPEQCVVEYHSSRQLCQFMEGVLDGVATRFQVPIEQHQEGCMLRGDPACRFRLHFGRPAP